jgi:hypothetical protein
LDIKGLRQEIRVEIGGIVISTIRDKTSREFCIDETHRHFATSQKADIFLRVYRGPILKRKLRIGETVFSSQTTWSLCKGNGKFILKVPSKTAILEPNFKSGEIYIETQRMGSGTDFPLKYPFGEVLMINFLSKGRGIIFHACGVNDQDQGFLFVGTSGGGKSTVANLWKKKVSNPEVTNSKLQTNLKILSDDRIIVRKMEGRFWMYGTPWHGDAKVYSPERAPLEKIFFLKHAKKNSIKKIASMEATSRLLVCSFPTFWDKKGMEFTLGFIDELVTKVPCYELGFVPDKTVIDFVRNL